MPAPARMPAHLRRRNAVVEALCVLVVLASFVALLVWIVATAGGGVLMN